MKKLLLIATLCSTISLFSSENNQPLFEDDIIILPQQIFHHGDFKCVTNIKLAKSIDTLSDEFGIKNILEKNNNPTNTFSYSMLVLDKNKVELTIGTSTDLTDRETVRLHTMNATSILQKTLVSREMKALKSRNEESHKCIMQLQKAQVVSGIDHSRTLALCDDMRDEKKELQNTIIALSAQNMFLMHKLTPIFAEERNVVATKENEHRIFMIDEEKKSFAEMVNSKESDQMLKKITTLSKKLSPDQFCKLYKAKFELDKRNNGNKLD